MRSLLLLAAIALGGSPLVAQPAAGRPAVLLGGGLGGQYDGDHAFSSPGWSAAVGLEWRTASVFAVRLEAQRLGHGEQASVPESEAPGWVESVGALSALAVWAPRRDAPVYLLGSAAVVRALLPRGFDPVVTSAGVVGAGVQATPILGMELQYLHWARLVGRARSAVVGRVVVRL